MITEFVVTTCIILMLAQIYYKLEKIHALLKPESENKKTKEPG